MKNSKSETCRSGEIRNKKESFLNTQFCLVTDKECDYRNNPKECPGYIEPISPK